MACGTSAYQLVRPGSTGVVPVKVTGRDSALVSGWERCGGRSRSSSPMVTATVVTVRSERPAAETMTGSAPLSASWITVAPCAEPRCAAPRKIGRLEARSHCGERSDGTEQYEVTGMNAAPWAAQSTVTAPGAAVAAIDALPGEISALREACSQFVFHYRAGGDFAENGVPAERTAEIETRYADLMFALLLERQPELAADRRPARRVVGCCRDSAILFLALARHKGIPARARVGFAAYLRAGWMIDHVVAEVWDSPAARWRLIDPGMASGWQPEVNGRAVDWMDLTDDQFVTGPRAWQAARAGRTDPERYLTDPELDIPVLRGWPYIAHNVVHDLAALNKTEMLLWDGWGLQLALGPGPFPGQEAALLDELCARTSDPGVSPQVIAELAARACLRVPPTVTSFDPYGGPPREVQLRSL